MALTLGAERLLVSSTATGQEYSGPQFGSDGDSLYWNTIGSAPTRYFKYTISTNLIAEVSSAGAVLAYRTTSQDGTRFVSGGELRQVNYAGIGTLLSPSSPYAVSAANGLGFSADDRFILYDFQNPAVPGTHYYFFKDVGTPVHVGSDSATVPDNNYVFADVLANDTDIDAGDTKQIILMGQGSQTDASQYFGHHGQFTLGNDVFITTSSNGPINLGYSPPPLPEGVQDTQTFYYDVRDLGGWVSRGLVNVTYVGVNDPPQAHNPPNTIVLNEDSLTQTIGIAAPSDPDGDPIVSVQIKTLPSRGVVALAGGTPVSVGMDISVDDLMALTFTPRPNEFGTTRTPFEYTLFDSHGAHTVGDVGWNILPLEDAPVAEGNKTIAVAKNSGGTALMVASPTDPDGDQLVVTVTELPSSGEVRTSTGTVVTANQTLTLAELLQLAYVPLHDFTGNAGAFTYLVSDQHGGTASQTLAFGVSPVTPGAFAQSDFNLDQRSDLLWRQPSGMNELWHMSGPAVQDTKPVQTVGSNWIAHSGDFNGDGDTDLFWFDQTSSQTELWIMQDSRVISTRSLGQMTAGWSVSSGDFNGDGKTDLFWHHDQYGFNEIWLMNGSTVTATNDLPNVADWTLVSSGDLNGDNNRDLLWHNQAFGYNDAWTIQNGAYQGETMLPATSSGWTVSASGDFNGDGKTDLLWQHTSGLIEFWFLGAAGVSGISDSRLANSSDTVATTGDYNGDGRIDLLWQHHPSNLLTMWLMDGGAAASITDISSVGDGWWAVA